MNNQIQLLKRTNSATKSALTRNAKIISTKNTVYAKYNDIMNKKNIAVRNYNALLDVEKKTKEQRIRLNYLKAAISEFKKDITVINKEVKKVQEAVKDRKDYDDFKNSTLRRSVIQISKTINSDYKPFTHEVQLHRMQRALPNKLYRQTVKYYYSNGLLVDDHLWHPEIEKMLNFTNQIFEMLTVDKGNLEKIMNRMIPEYDLGWLITLFLEIEPAGHVDIITEAIDPIAFDRFNLQQSEQVYRENESKTCVIDGCLKFFEQIKDTNRNAKASFNKLTKLYDNYLDGIKESDLAKFGEMIDSSITIINLIDGSKKEFNKTKFNRFSIKFINTKYNHLDVLSHNYNEPELITKTHYNQIKKNSLYYVDNCGTLYTIEKTYKLKEDDFKSMYNEWKKDNNFDELFILENSKEYDMVNTYEHNMHTFFNKFEINDIDYKEIDLKKAYYNYSNKNMNSFYKGVPAGAFINFKCNDDYTIDNFNKTELIGFYQVQILEIIDKVEHCNKLGFTVNSIHTLTTANIDLLQKFIKFKFLNASTSTTCHIPFTENFLKTYQTEEDKEKKFAGVKAYCKAYGIMLGSFQTVIELKPLENDIKYYSTIDNENYNMYVDEYGIVKIYDIASVPKRYVHIAQTIHGYTTTLIMQQIFNMDIDQIFGVKLDSIVYKKDYKINYDKNLFSVKSAKIKKMLENENYTPSCEYETGVIYSGLTLCRNYKVYQFEALEFPTMFTQNGEYIYKPVVLIGGQGGSGKTRSLLKEFFPRKSICYTTTCWNLIEGMTRDYDKTCGLSLPKMLGNIEVKGEEKAVEKIVIKSCKINVIDEATLVTNDEIQNIISEYPRRLTFILGDIDEDDFYYQCSITDNIIKPSQNKNIQYVSYTKAYRFEETYNNKLLALRKFMKDNHKIQYANYKLTSYIKKEFAQCFKNKEDVVFNNNDIGISGNNDFLKNDNQLTKYFMEKGTAPQYFTKYTVIQKGIMRGRRLTEKPAVGENYECKLFKTIHSFQGLQLDQDNKIIISIKSNFDYNLFYTALSRARRLDQVVILNN